MKFRTSTINSDALSQPRELSGPYKMEVQDHVKTEEGTNF